MVGPVKFDNQVNCSWAPGLGMSEAGSGLGQMSKSGSMCKSEVEAQKF